MKDLHSHYLPGVDDGARMIDETIEMLHNANLAGVTDIMFTPHYILDSKYSQTKDHNEKIFASLKDIALKENINIYLGNEVYCNDSILDLHKKGLIKTLNDSRYMLIEIPMYSKMNNIKSIFFELISNGITPILAHPERYTAYYNDLEFFYSLRVMGVLMQVNFTSLIGGHGPKAKRMAKKLLKNNLISFIGSDIHRANDNKYAELPKILKKLKKIVGEEKFIELTETNFDKIINDEEI